MDLYSSTNFVILKPWVIISNLIRFNLGPWQASWWFDRKLKYREKILEDFQCFPGFAGKMALYWSTNLRILKALTNISNLIRFDLGFWQALKLFQRKLKYREKLLEDFHWFPQFPRKMVLYSSTNFRILKLCVIISNLLRFNLGFWQASIPVYRKLKYREKVLEELQRLPRLPRKMVLYSSTNFCILMCWTILSNLRRFDWGFWLNSKPFYRKLKYREKVLEEFQRFPCFPIKIVLYSSTNFCILKPWAIVSNVIRFDLGFWQASKLI